LAEIVILHRGHHHDDPGHKPIKTRFLVFVLFFSLFDQWRSKHNQGQGEQYEK
jgi:hypothetical protein